MFLTFLIPNFNLEKNINIAHQMYATDGPYPATIKGFPQTQIDNFTDLEIMAPRMLATDSAIHHAMDMDNYARYWHGYAVVLKPLLSFFEMKDIRLIYNTVVIFLLCYTSYSIATSVNKTSSIAFILSMTAMHVEIFGLSLQISNMFIVMMLFIIFICRNKTALICSNNIIPLYFFILGSVINFIDLLTAPVASLSIPLIIIILFLYEGKATFISSIKTTILSSISWGLGYGLTWVAKWLIASVILGQNVFLNAIQSMFFRTVGNENYPIHRIDTILNNFTTMFYSEYMLIALGVVLLMAIILKSRISLSLSLPLLLISLIPYIWYTILSNHSQIHTFFTYRAQGGTFMIFLIMLAAIIRPNSFNFRK
ncbi:hypothetical protein E0V05_08640 [Salmonella enterica subsp. enterica serovar Hvittingfoss]|nr:hypothetical protein [Salmonella enterica]EBG7041475.1 hypothetical protein [Salmonella enterica subsp. enterica serovar Hvittingfoss]ECD4935780.1 hypothetical protein [Salmonella enterica subsp. enterica]EDH6028458.1 hypothetical protein [Salmonella enterica subsp. enterica serovar Agama]EDR5813066.1 hypothetical protein [Salmonella enterica subsp. enterica serovar Soumbedioune]EDT6748547.1 hypothetical protein [Salmonella enterica subsp. enterica serovar Wandsworth]EGB5302554.1 hypotheti